MCNGLFTLIFFKHMFYRGVVKYWFLNIIRLQKLTGVFAFGSNAVYNLKNVCIYFYIYIYIYIYGGYQCLTVLVSENAAGYLDMNIPVILP